MHVTCLISCYFISEVSSILDSQQVLRDVSPKILVHLYLIEDFMNTQKLYATNYLPVLKTFGIIYNPRVYKILLQKPEAIRIKVQFGMENVSPKHMFIVGNVFEESTGMLLWTALGNSYFIDGKMRTPCSGPSWWLDRYAANEGAPTNHGESSLAKETISSFASEAKNLVAPSQGYKQQVIFEDGDTDFTNHVAGAAVIKVCLEALPKILPLDEGTCILSITEYYPHEAFAGDVVEMIGWSENTHSVTFLMRKQQNKQVFYYARVTLSSLAKQSSAHL